ncbi:hypothetical protein IB213_08905 [Comamonas sp. CMM02]|nr:hypothetical protein [Comamonas sp. CMM02]
MQIRTICMTFSNVSNAAVLPDLQQQLPQDEVLERLTGDGAYEAQPVQQAVLRRGATPVIAPGKNARIRKGSVFNCSMQRLPPASD